MKTLPEIHLINLDRSTERLRRFQELNWHLKDVVRVPAIHGAALNREELVESGYISENLSYGAGTLGSALSHLKLWEMAVAQNRSITVFEDAIVVSHEFETYAREVLSGLPEDWDFIQWGYNFNPSFLWVDLGTSKARLQGYGRMKYQEDAELRDFQSTKLESHPVPLRVLHSFGIMGYSISPSGARAALEYCLPLRNRLITFEHAGVVTGDTSIDIALAGLYPALKAYICVPQIVIRYNKRDSIREAIDQEMKG